MKELHAAVRQWMNDHPQVEDVAINPAFWYSQDKGPGGHNNTKIRVTLFRMDDDNCYQLELPMRSNTAEIIQALHDMLLQAEMTDNVLIGATIDATAN